jgi:hypothetical protein
MNIFSFEMDAKLLTTYLATLRQASETLFNLTIEARTPSYNNKRGRDTLHYCIMDGFQDASVGAPEDYRHDCCHGCHSK